MTELLALAGISVSFAGVKAISAVSFTVEQGEMCAVIGPNGAGKSSLLNVITGVYRPDTGSIRFAGKTHTRMLPNLAAESGIARTTQNLALFKGMSVLDNLLTGRTLHTRAGCLAHALQLPRARRDELAQRAAVERVLHVLELSAHRHSVVNKLSYGLQKRVELGRALAAEPRLLLLDEPMAGMTFEEKLELSSFIVDVNESLGTTVLLIEHDMGVIMDLSDHVVVLDYGRKIADGSPAEIQRDQAVIDAYLGAAH